MIINTIYMYVSLHILFLIFKYSPISHILSHPKLHVIGFHMKHILQELKVIDLLQSHRHL